MVKNALQAMHSNRHDLHDLGRRPSTATVMGLLWQQTKAFFLKNWIVLLKHPIINLLRCIVLPIALAVVLAKSPTFFTKRQKNGLGSPSPILNLRQVFSGRRLLVWADQTNGSGSLEPRNIITHITRNFDSDRLNAVKEVKDLHELLEACPPRKCFGALTFDALSSPAADTEKSVNYTMRTDSGTFSFYVDTQEHHMWAEETTLPLQLAIDQAIIELTTGVDISTPLEWPFSPPDTIDYEKNGRLALISLMKSFLIFVFLIAYIGITYHTAGAVALERATHLTPHMKAMGLSDWARIIAWHSSLSLAYLPGWIVISLVWAYLIFAGTSPGIVFVVHLLLGLGLASWSLFVAVPFGKSPYLASIFSSVAAVVLAVIASTATKLRMGPAVVLSLIFPPMNYAFSLRSICAYELAERRTNVIKPAPKDGLILLPFIIIGVINILIWPCLAVFLERWLYDAGKLSALFKKQEQGLPRHIPEGIAISIQNLKKTYRSFRFRRMKTENVEAIIDLSMDIPKGGVFTLLGPNGAGKSTTLDVLGGLIGLTSGTVIFEGGINRPPHGTLGIVPQKNVLFPELSCLQTLQLWKEIKRSPTSLPDEDLQQLLHDCDLAGKIHSEASTLSGGQKRKLQLAIGLVGGSTLVLVDECTSGVDPISRRALWKTLTSHHDDRTIVLTTHFLDEADLLSDGIAVLGTHGKLVAEGSPVSLKSNLGEGYTVQVTFLSGATGTSSSVLMEHIRHLAPHTYMTLSSPSKMHYHLKTKDSAIVENVLHTINSQRGTLAVGSYDVLGTSMEDIFLDLMEEEKILAGESKHHHDDVRVSSLSSPLKLANGRQRSPWAQALTIFHKRVMILRRSWIAPLLALLIVILLSYFPLKYLRGATPGCLKVEEFIPPPSPLYLPSSPSFEFVGPVLLAPPNVTSILNITTTRDVPTQPSSSALPLPPSASSSGTLPSPSASTSADASAIPLLRRSAFIQRTKLSVRQFGGLTPNITHDLPDQASFIQEIESDFARLSYGGISLNLETREALLAFMAISIYQPLQFLNLAMNVFYNHALNTTSTPSIIHSYHANLPDIDKDDLFSLQWVAVFIVAMILFSAFSALYVAKERQSSVQAMQASNGLSDPIGLYLGHLLFDLVSILIACSIIVGLFSHAVGDFFGLGLLWLVMVLYCVAASLLSYCSAILMSSPIAAFAMVVLYQAIIFVLYLLPYILTKTFAIAERAPSIINACHFTISLLAPVASLTRAAFVSINLFKLDCVGESIVGGSALGTITRYGGPILYLIIQSILLMYILVWADSGSLEPWRVLFRTRGSGEMSTERIHMDVKAEADEASRSHDVLRVLGVSKSYKNIKAVDSVSFSVARNTMFAMLGPNGAGKTTTLDIIRGSIAADSGDVVVNNHSMMRQPSTARWSLGVCPQFTTIDAQLTTMEHLIVYGRLKGLHRGEELDNSVSVLLKATGLDAYANRLANRLSGGNQRKLSLAIALIGNPPVILIDEFSTGIDASVKRELWKLLKEVAPGKAFVITTHSMEEASSLANKVGILSRRMLAVGSPSELAGRYSTYTVHFSCRTRADKVKAQALMARIPGSTMAHDLSTRFEVPIVPTRAAARTDNSFKTEKDEVLSLADLFHLLAEQTDFPEFAVEKSGLEAAFIKIIRENDAIIARTEEEEMNASRRTRRKFLGIV